jgi:hypothetical protein
MRTVLAAAAVSLALVAAACSDINPFYCDLDAQCIIDDEHGVCTAYNQCAFADATCPAPQLRYEESAGELADVCVGDEEDF